MSLSAATIAVAQPQTISLDVVINSGHQRIAFRELVEAFEVENPNVRVKINARSAVAHKSMVDQWEQEGKVDTDVFYWFAGNRMQRLSDPGLVKPITELWNKASLNDSFDFRIKRLVSDGAQVYGLPFAYYQWGLYYSKAVFERFGLDIPNDWESLLAICDSLKKENTYCFTLGAQEPWAIGAWFDYLNLRLNGLYKHLAVLSGRLPFDSAEVINVLETWQHLIDQGYFVPEADERNWQDAMPYIFHGDAAMVLMGNFVGSIIPERFADDFGFFAFPDIKQGVKRYEDAPIDIFLVSSATKYPEAAEKLLLFMSRASSQEKLNRALKTFSPHTQVKTAEGMFANEGLRTLQNAAGFAQFLDRDASKPYADLILKALVAFHTGSKSLTETTQSVEQGRITLNQ